MKVILSIEGMSCSACSSALEKYLNKQKGVVDASVNLVLATATIMYDETLSLNDLERFIEEAGYKSLGIYSEEKVFKKEKLNKRLFAFYTILSILILYISMSHMVGLPVIPLLNMEKYPVNYAITLLILSLPYLYYGKDILKSGYLNLVHKSPNMDTLVSIGVLASLIYSIFNTIMIIKGQTSYVESLYYESFCIVIYFVKLGRFIDTKSKSKTKEAIKELVQVTPTKALLKTREGEKEISIDEVKKHDTLICKPGEKIAVDGNIISGSAYFDEAFITGESKLIKKKIGDKVIAGSINTNGYITYEAINIGKDSTISEIVRLVVEATNTKPTIAKVADKVSSIFVPSILLIAFLTLIFNLLTNNLDIALTRFVTALVVACPCSLGLATPLAVIVSEGFCAKKGLLIKNSESLELLNSIDTIVFDKTGTLTYGNLQVSTIYNYSDYSDKKILELVTSLENKSTHPIAKAFKGKSDLAVTKFNNIAGLGVSGTINDKKYYLGNDKLVDQLMIYDIHSLDFNRLVREGNSVIYVVEERKVIALIGVKDTLRSNAKEVIKKLKKSNKKVLMLTGDNKETANIISKDLALDEVKASLLPKEKTTVIKELLKENRKVMMVGDGINDAPSLATATIGVAIASGTDIANNSSDIILMNDNLESILNLFIICKKTIRNIKQNLFFSFFYNILMIPIAIGLFAKFNIIMNPMIASFAMTLSSLTVVINALRLRKIKLEGK
ncbi:MAG: heavy metal translocating P-type ATPase [Clostridium sp.]|nr:heavy metal translocating P-type ATPase [Clostridium sp.]